MNAPEDSTDASSPEEVSFDTGCMGCMVIVLFMSVKLFGIAAFDSDFYAALADGNSRRNLLPALAPFRLGEVNVAVLLVAVYMLHETLRMGRKVTDRRAVWIDGEKLRFHRSLR